MRALILTDADTAAREGQLLSRMEVGLIGHGIRILYAEPSDDQLHVDAESLIAGLEYTSGGSILTLKARARKLVRDVDEAIGFDDPTSSRLDLVHVLGSGAWGIGLQAAVSAGSYLVVEVLNAQDLERVRPFENRVMRAFGGEARFAWLAPGPSMYQALRDHAKSAPIYETYWGTHTSAHAHPQASGEILPSIAIVTSGIKQDRLLRFLDAVKQYQPTDGAEHPMCFLDEHAVRRTHEATRYIRALGIDDRISIVPSLEHSRALTMNCDVLVLPDADGQHRSLTLEAMANGVLVLAARDPLLDDLLIDQTTALLADRPTPGVWKDLLTTVLDRKNLQCQTIRDQARQFVKEHRVASAHIDAIAAAYNQICGEQAIPFGGPAD
ncbi:MAG: glycosyltransferase [Phycisphaerales bacterium JB050]